MQSSFDIRLFHGIVNSFNETLKHDYNQLLLHVIENMDGRSLKNRWFKEDGEITLESLVNDYFEHMKIHIDHFRNRLEEICALRGP